MTEGVNVVQFGVVHMKRTALKSKKLTAVVITSTGLVVSALMLAGTATATPADDPCPLAMSFLCGFLPIAPELDGDVDLTKQHPPTDPAASTPDSLQGPL